MVAVVILLLIGGWFRMLEKQAAKSGSPPSLLANTRQPSPTENFAATPVVTEAAYAYAPQEAHIG